MTIDKDKAKSVAKKYGLEVKGVRGKVVTVTHSRWGNYKIVIRTQGKDHRTGEPLWLKAHLSQEDSPTRGISSKMFWSKETEQQRFQPGIQYTLVEQMCRFVSEQEPYQERLFA